MTDYLIDLASYQHGINLAVVRAAGFSKVNIKLTQGTSYVDPDIAEFVDGARANHMDISTFHWLDGRSSGAAQASAALAQMDRFGLRYGTAHQVDCEDTTYPATWAIWRDYVNAIQDALGRHVIAYTGDWWWTGGGRNWNGASLTPYAWAAPNHGYDAAYPGDGSAEWTAGYGGWATYAALQYAVSPIANAGGGNLSKTAFRDPKVWTALTGVDAAFTNGEDVALMDDPNGAALAWRVESFCQGSDTVVGGPTTGESLTGFYDKIATRVAAKVTAPAPAPVDAASIKAALLDPEVLAAIAKAVNDDDARRMAA